MPDVHAARRLIDQDELWAVLQALTKPDLWLAMLNRNTRPAGYEVFVAFLWQSVFFFLDIRLRWRCAFLICFFMTPSCLVFSSFSPFL